MGFLNHQQYHFMFFEVFETSPQVLYSEVLFEVVKTPSVVGVPFLHGLFSREGVPTSTAGPKIVVS